MQALTISMKPASILRALLAGSLLCFLGCAAGKPKQNPTPSTPAESSNSNPATLTTEDSNNALKLAQESRLELQTLRARLKELEGQVQTLAEQMEAIPVDKLQQYDAQLDSLKRKIAQLPEPSPNPALTAGTLPPKNMGTVKPAISAAEAALYKKASDLYFDRKYSEAMQVYRQLQTQNPQGGYADNAQYWTGECLFALKQYNEAIAAFRKVLEFKETEKADDAQIKLGYCYLRLGDRAHATEEFRKVVSLYPDSEYFEKAKSELTQLESRRP